LALPICTRYTARLCRRAAGARLEGGDHALDRLGEQQPHGVLQQQRAELELQREDDLVPPGCGRNCQWLASA
jgi:hypothetical protein